MELIYSESTNLGECLVSFYKAPGDLYEAWVFETVESGVVPDARYGPDAPEYNHLVGPSQLTEVIETFDDHGSIKRIVSIYADGRLLVSRPI